MTREMSLETRAYFRERRASLSSARANKLRAAAAEDVVWAWNQAHPVGSPVRCWPGVREGAGRETTVRAPAFVAASLDPVVWLVGVRGYIHIGHVEGLA